MDPRECIRHTRKRWCVITNIDADRVLYSEIPQTPPLTPARPPPSSPVSIRSLPLSLPGPQPSQSKIPEPRRRSASRLSESWEWIEFQRKAKAKERKGVKGKDLNLSIQIFFKGGGVMRL